MMNSHDQAGPNAQEAVLEYRPVETRLVKAGHFVRCAMTGEPIRLEDLKYWSVAFQEPYASPEAVMARLKRSQAIHM